MNKIVILGGGAWGTAIANVVAGNIKNKVFLWTRDEKSADEINELKTNEKYVGDVKLDENIFATTKLSEAIENAGIIFVVLPSFAVDEVIKKLADLKVDFEKNFVICTKGLDKNSNKFFSDLFFEKFEKSNIAVLCGPNFADEVLAKEPTITTIATKNIGFFNIITDIMNCDYFSVEYFEDIISLQLCGLVKNITAIICGIVNGLELGRNTFAAVVTKGLKEIDKLCEIFNCNKKVVITSAGIGDLVLTCSSLQSRNMNFGFRIGQGENIGNILKDHKTIEGLANAETLSKLTKYFKIENSLSCLLLEIIKNNYSREELKDNVISRIL